MVIIVSVLTGIAAPLSDILTGAGKANQRKVGVNENYGSYVYRIKNKSRSVLKSFGHSLKF